jgi:quercetin dioxygenase-like cupin family protein
VKNITFYTFVLLLFSCSGSEEKFLHPDSVSPKIYEVLLENDAVTVIMATFKPGHGDKMHDHNPMTFHVLKGGKAKFILPDGSVNEREISSGFTGYNSKLQRHQVTNVGDNQVKILLVEHS